jgi:hypothetical protein
MTVGDQVIINLGKNRGKEIRDILLPNDMLKDGTIVTVAKIHDSHRVVCVKECPWSYSYPLEVLSLLRPQILLQRKINEYRQRGN